MASNIPITNGQGQSSVAAEEISSLKYQQIKVVGGETGSTSVWGINPDRSAQVSVVGTISAAITGSPSISGTVNIGDIKQSVFGASVIGAVPVTQITSPWAVTNVGSVITANIGSVITVWQGSSVIGVVTGSVVTIPTGNQSISGAVQIAGISPASIAAVQRLDTKPVGSTLGLVTHAILHGREISGSQTFYDVRVDGGTNAIMSSVVGLQGASVSGTVGASVIGWIPIQASNTSVITYVQNSSIIAINAGSVVALSQGSVITVWQSPSIVGTYAEDAAHATGDKGIFALQVRNDTMSSITSADGDYSPISGGPVGETITANSPITKWVQGTADLRGAATTGASAIAIAAGGSSIFTYITGVQVANMGSASVLVTFASGGSILGYTIAPAGGGSNIYYPNALKTPANFGFAASISGVASVLVSAQGFISKT